LLTTFYDFLVRHFKRNVKSHVFLKSEKKRKIRILEHGVTLSLTAKPLLRSFGYCFIASRSHRVSLIVIPFCLSVCLDVCRSFLHLQPTTIDRSQPHLVGTCPRTRVSLFGSPTSHTFGARGKNMQNFAYFQHVDSEMAAL